MKARNLLPILAIFLLGAMNPIVSTAQSAGDIVITEVMYNSPQTDEWIEIYNTTGSTINLDSKWRLSYGSTNYDFTGTSITAGSYITIGVGSDGDGTFNNDNAFTPTISTIGASIASVNDPNNLDDGATISIVFDPAGVNTTIDEITFTTSSPWPSNVNGDGPTMELIHTSADNSSGSNWQGSTKNGGTPGDENSKFLTSNTSSPSITTASHWSYGSGLNAVPGANDNITISSGHTLEVTSSATVNDVSISGTATLSSGTFTCRDITVNSGGDITNAGTLSYDDITQNNGGTVSLGGTVNMDQGGVSEINGGNVTFTGDLTQSNNTDFDIGTSITVTLANTASLIQTSGSFTGEALTIDKRGLSDDMAYNIWSSPITSAALSSAFPNANACDVYIWGEITQTWTYDYTAGHTATCNGNPVTFQSNNVISGGDGIMDAARGYYAPGNATSTRSFVGTPNTGNINFTMGTSGDAWNLIGNPYPCAIDLDEVMTTNSSNFDGNFYFWIDDLGGGSGYTNADFAYYNGSGGTAANGVTPTQYLASGQGFWVAASSATFSFTDAHKVSSNNSVFYKSNNSDISRSWFSLSNNDLSSQILIAFTEQATDGHDDFYDAIKWEGNPDIYFTSKEGNNDYAIQGLDELYALRNEDRSSPSKSRGFRHVYDPNR